ncbi:MAG: formylglycine-generating enzyme family protein [Pyrinomonadaceae bacterium]|nr:formylglycine-generating enzyme family protein [Pyrinomonadaceae bacterium]
MTEKTAQTLETLPVSQPAEDSRMLPLAVAGLVCFVIAVILGTGSWMLFGSHPTKKTAQETAVEIQPIAVSNSEPPVNMQIQNTTAANTAANPNPEPAVNLEGQGVLKIGGGEVVLGGGNTKLPLERAIVGEFWIAETEVTNAQYAEFVKDANYPAPSDWKKGEIPAGRENFPVANISWNDAAEFCKWKEKKIGLPVRLPTEAEWEFAARGREGYKFPWGNTWNADGVTSKEKGGKVSAVKSFSLNRSPFGVYDMFGNVWEWTNDKVGKTEQKADEDVKKAAEKGESLRIVKGGSAEDEEAELSAMAVQIRYQIPESTKISSVGFRYVIIQKK